MKALSENKKAYFDYEIVEKFQAGLVLLGHEVKSIKSGRMQMAGAYVVFKDSELFLIGSNIPPYQPKNTPDDYNPERTRKLLVQKSEIRYLIGKTKEKGLTLVPFKVYTTPRGKIKLEFGLAKGKKKADKREKIKKRDVDRDIRRALKES